MKEIGLPRAVLFAAFCAGLGLRHFSAEELLFMGESHSNPEHPAFGLNSLPSPELWSNIVPTIMVADRLREASGGPLTILSAYRSPDYNEAIDGAKQSQHVKFAALDVRSSVWTPAQCFDWLRKDRAAGGFVGGLGAYETFTHIDCRGTNATWGKS
ncbi:D-Ala-D-Ala carboxypeptidase family metallohydrolase [Pseudovibrio denitrificans]|uniref:D-Ala-D-Ala carboxypeptidase family metallohydrolase n=1 Tax=Pseudovibrio denitrificans TaxID=258256 RepID=UPI0039BF0917